MIKAVALLIAFLVTTCCLRAQTFQVDTLSYKGDINKYINIVIMGDGYTSTQQTTFITAANNLFGYLFAMAPWAAYRDYFNVFAIRVISAQSGIKHPNTASDCNTASVLVANPTTYLGCTFDAFGIHRLVVPQNTANVAAVLATNFPGYDQVFVVANSPYYGGSGGAFATSTTDASSKDITAHEIGHSFANLADEYYAGDVYAAEKANMTQQTSPTLVKWKNWIGTNGISINQHCCGGNSAVWYKPHTNCKMQTLSASYCSVCSQALIETIHALTNPIVSYLPAASAVSSSQQYLHFKLSRLMRPQPNTLKIVWKLDGNVMANNKDSVQVDQNTLANGAHTLTGSVTDTTSLLRVDNHATVHISSVTWTINKSATGISLAPANNEISYSLYPNPAGDVLNVALELEKGGEVLVQLMSTDGRLVSQRSKQMRSGKNVSTLDVHALSPGAYIITITVGNHVHSQTWTKQ